MNQDTIDAAKIAAAQYKVPLANLLACIEVESNGVISARIEQADGSVMEEPLIRWEGHYFDKRLGANTRAAARRMGLASPTAGAIKNPTSQQARWTKLFFPGFELNEKAAVESVSWGVGQVMGAHWDKLGYASPSELMLAVRSGVAGQIDVMLRYCVRFGLIDELQRGDFAGFARGYNGPNYKKYAYDTKMLAGAKKWARAIPGAKIIQNPKRAVNAASMVRMGTEGAKVRQLQQLLKRAGHAVDVDGDFGPATKNAVRSFQQAHGLEVDGIVGPETWQALEAFKADPVEQPGVPGIAEAVIATPEGRQGAAAVGSAVGLETAKGAISTATDSLAAMTEVPIIKYVFTGLTVLSVLLTVGGIAWVAWGWWKANTNRGIVTGDVELPTVHEDV